jgi:hypothetical protein
VEESGYSLAEEEVELRKVVPLMGVAEQTNDPECKDY